MLLRSSFSPIFFLGNIIVIVHQSKSNIKSDKHFPSFPPTHIHIFIHIGLEHLNLTFSSHIFNLCMQYCKFSFNICHPEWVKIKSFFFNSHWINLHFTWYAVCSIKQISTKRILFIYTHWFFIHFFSRYKKGNPWHNICIAFMMCGARFLCGCVRFW